MTRSSGQKRSTEVLAAAAAGFEQFVEQNGGDADRVLGEVGLSSDAIAEPTRAMPLSAYCCMLEEAAERTRNPNFGLLYGRQFEPQMLGLIGFIALASPTVGSALRNFTDLFPLHQNGTETCLASRDSELRMEYRITDPSITRRRQDAEFTLAAFANVVRAGLGPDWSPVRVEFEHVSPHELADYDRTFDAEARFGCATNALVFRLDGLDAAMPGGNLMLLDLLRASLAAVACGGDAAGSDIVARAAEEVRLLLVDGAASLSTVAERLHMPARTLQRRLSDRGLSFSQLVEEVRKRLARTYLRQPEIPLTEIALLLGYSESSAFSRAFRQWYGVSPSRFR